MRNIIFILSLLFGIISTCLKAQVPMPDSLKEQTPAPLELPNFIIEGTERLNVRSGIKQMPGDVPSLKASELDSLNSLEKQMSVALPISELPDRIYEYYSTKGFIQGSFGNFITPSVQAGWGLNYEGYELYANGGLELTDGHVDNSDYQDAFLKVTSDYIAPEKFFIFGGSRTRTELNFNHRGYQLYAANDPDNRSLSDFSLDIRSVGKHERLQFSTGAGFSTMHLSSGDNNAFDNSIHGFVNLQSLWRSYYLSAKADIDFRSVRGDANNFAQVGAEASVFGDRISLKAGAGFQFASATNDDNRSGIMLSADMEYRMNKFFTIKAKGESGLEKITFNELLWHNLYLHHSSGIDFPYKIFMIDGRLMYHPGPDFGIAPGMKFGITDRYPVFTSIGDETIPEIGLAFEKVNRFELFAESFLNASDNDKLTGFIKFNLSDTDDGDTELSYVPLYEMEFDYSRNWLKSFRTSFGIEIVGERETALKEGKTLDPFYDINFSAEYLFSKSLKFFFNADNILNNDIYIWEGYKERFTFVNFGVNWKFN